MCHASGGIAMCDVTVRSRLARTTPRPRWSRLYGIVTLMLAALAAIELVVLPGPAQTLIGCGLALGGCAAMAQWARRNRVALDQQGWCECASATLTVRVIPSDRPEPEHAEKEEEEEARVFALVAR